MMPKFPYISAMIAERVGVDGGMLDQLNESESEPMAVAVI